MSTRCHLIVRGAVNDTPDEWTYIYHHFDGYPEGVGKDIASKFNEVIKPNVVGHKYTLDDIVDFICDIEDGYEVDDGLHGDEEYVYVITLDEHKEGVTIVCYETLSFSFDTYPTEFHKDNGFDKVYELSIHNTGTGLKDINEEKDELDEFKAKIQSLHNVVLLNMMRAICDELTLRETE